ncbi:MAG: ribosome small subunit-dependent GTPase A [Erysipelotrichaceae bacterium]|nr:ribosome small subunit-dependent GTPase A [Erysipelotrichaceae bacterium]
MAIATVIRIVSNQYTVILEDGTQTPAVAMGKLRKQTSPLVGDRVECDFLEGKWCMQKILPRKNQLIRPAIANVDQAIVVMSCKEPDFSYTLVDRMIFLISYQGIRPMILLTKTDLEKTEKIEEIVSEYQNSGYKVVCVNPTEDLEVIKSVFSGKISVLTGQSGVGKSTLLNYLDPNYIRKTQEISKALGRGKHTTRHTELFEVCGGWIADTPGFSSMDFSDIKKTVLRDSIYDFHGIEECRFRDCMHIREPGCAIIKAVEEHRVSKIRYQNYLDVLPVCELRKEWEK